MKFRVSKTFSVVTPESAKNGEESDSGFEYADQEMDVRDIVRELECCSEISTSPCRTARQAEGTWAGYYESVDPYTGAQTGYNLHVKATGRNLLRLYRLARLVK